MGDSRKLKTKILDEFVAATCLHRKAAIRLLNHPAPLILAATFLTFLAFRSMGWWKDGVGVAALKTTIR